MVSDRSWRPLDSARMELGLMTAGPLSLMTVDPISLESFSFLERPVPEAPPRVPLPPPSPKAISGPVLPHGLGAQLHICKKGMTRPLSRRDHVGICPRYTPEDWEAVWTKPCGGLWTSTWLGEERGSDWVRHASREFPGWHAHRGDDLEWMGCHLLVPAESARVFHIDSYADLDLLHEQFPVFKKAFDGVTMLRGINWGQVAHAYDAVHLTDEGYRTTEQPRDEPELEHLTTYRWDAESTCWFRWVFDETESLGAHRFEPRMEEQDELAA